jgi:hypothetical protein
MRARIAFLVLLLYVGASVVRWLNRAAESAPTPGQDEISLYEHRFQELRTVLPERGIVGYQGHPELTTALPGQGLAHLHFQRFLLTQYALAPVLLVEGTEPEFVVGNFDPGAVPPLPQGLQLVRDFGNGVLLFRRPGS